MRHGVPVGEVMCDELVVVVVDGLAEDPALAEADRVLGARLDDRVDHSLHLVQVDAGLLGEQLQVLPPEDEFDIECSSTRVGFIWVFSVPPSA